MTAELDIAGLHTVGQVAAATGYPVQRVSYAVAKIKARPQSGRARVFDSDTVGRIVAELDRIEVSKIPFAETRLPRE